MTITTKHFAICPNGQKVTRGSKTRTYSHAVVARRCYLYDLDSAEKAGLGSITASSFDHYRAYLDGTSRFLAREDWQTEEQHAAQCARDIDTATKALAGCETLEDYRAHIRTEALGHVAAKHARGYYNTFEALGWCSRPDLAVKLYNQNADKPYYTDAAILEAQIA